MGEKGFIDLENRYNWTSSEEDNAGEGDGGASTCVATKWMSGHINTPYKRLLR